MMLLILYILVISTEIVLFQNGFIYFPLVVAVELLLYIAYAVICAVNLNLFIVMILSVIWFFKITHTAYRASKSYNSGSNKALYYSRPDVEDLDAKFSLLQWKRGFPYNRNRYDLLN